MQCLSTAISLSGSSSEPVFLFQIKPVMNQVESHPYLVQKKLVDFCRQKGIVVTAYSPFGMAGAVVLKEPVIQDMAKRLGKSVAQVALRWQVRNG